MRRVWYAQVISLFGDFLALFAVIAVVSFRMHGTPAQLTGLQIAYMLPIVFVGPIAGVFVDRWPIKPTLISSDLHSRRARAAADSGDVALAGLRRAGGAQLRVGVLRAGADGDDPIARADGRPDVGERADADRVHGQPHRRALDRRRHRRRGSRRRCAT